MSLQTSDFVAMGAVAPGVATCSKVEGKDNVIYVRLVCSTSPKVSASGKTVILSSTHGGKPVNVGLAGVATLSLNLYTSPDA